MHCHLLAAGCPHSKLQEKDFPGRTLILASTLFTISPDKRAQIPFSSPPQSRPSSTSDRPDPSTSSRKAIQSKIAQHVSRIRLELAPPLVRQGRPLVVRIHTILKEKDEEMEGIMVVNDRKRWNQQDDGLENILRTRIWANMRYDFEQPCVHPPRRSYPQVRPQHLPSVLP